MFRASRVRAISVATILGAASLATGCVGGPDTETAPEEIQSEDEAPAMGAQLGAAMSAEGIAIDMGLSLVKAIGGKLATDYLFPTQTLDAKQLVADIDAAVASRLLELVLNAGKQGIGGASRDLADAEALFRNGGTPASSLPTTITVLSTLNYVLAGVDPNAPVAQQRAGTRIYALAAQLKMNTRMFRAQLDPANADAERKTLRGDLTRAIDELRQLVDAARNDEMNARLAKVGACTTWTRREMEYCNYGPQPIMCPKIHHWMGFADVAGPGYEIEDTALGFCEVERANYVRGAEDKFANETLNAKYAFEARMIDGWAAALAALEGKPAPQSGRALSLDFLGAFGLGTDNKHYVNPLTNYISCPTGSQESPLVGRDNVDWMARQCTTKPNLTGEPSYDFGGYFGYWRTPIQPPVGWACPDGFSPDAWTQIHGADGLDNPLHYCSRRHVPGTPQPFLYGGAYSRGGVDGTRSFANPATGLPTCPNGFVSTNVQGATFPDGRVKDHPITMCWKKFEPFAG